VFADPPIAVRTVCMDDPAIGTAADVAALLAVDQLHAAGMTGTGVRIAVVDTGINAAHLASRTTAKLAADGHYTPDGVFVRPGRAPLDHGTMCAFDTQIASTGSTLIDSAALLSTGPGLEAWLDDAIAAYDPLLGGLHDDGWPSLVVTNSWAVIPQAGDLPPQDPGNYSHNDHHLFTEQVRALGAAGADVLFAAGNCGAACDPSRCGYHDEPAIVGANSAEQVLTVGACDVSGTTAGYSSAGPGALFPDKPDVLGYAHFAGSQVFPVDNGTSAACPTIAGVVAAVRARYSPTDISPARLRDLLRASGSNAGVYGSETGYGRLDVASLIARLAAEVPNA
jgi:subtilisin family serine protease